MPFHSLTPPANQEDARRKTSQTPTAGGFLSHAGTQRTSTPVQPTPARAKTNQNPTLCGAQSGVGDWLIPQARFSYDPHTQPHPTTRVKPKLNYPALPCSDPIDLARTCQMLTATLQMLGAGRYWVRFRQKETMVKSSPQSGRGGGRGTVWGRVATNKRDSFVCSTDGGMIAGVRCRMDRIKPGRWIANTMAPLRNH